MATELVAMDIGDGVLCKLSFTKGKGGWRWRLQNDGNKKIVGASTEAYRNAKMCVKNFTFLTGYRFPENFKLKDPVTMTIALER